MRVLDEVYLERPIYGSRKMVLALTARGHNVNRKRVQRLMRLMGLEALVPKPNTSRSHPARKKVSVPAERARGDEGESGLGHRHHIHPVGDGLLLPGGRRGLVQ